MAFLVPFNIIVVLFVIIIFLSAIVSFKRLKITDKTLKLFMLLLIMCIWGIFTVGFSYGLLTFFTYFPAIILYSIPLNKQIRTLNFVTKWFSILMIGSISIFIITRVVHFGPPMGVLQLSSQNYDPFNNYILFIESTSIFNLIFYRFNGPFLEPGHLSLICSLLLFANQYRFKENRYLWVLLVCVLLSFSLAGYLISALGYILLKIRSIKLFLYSGIIFGSMFIFVSYVWNEGNNPINKSFQEWRLMRRRGLQVIIVLQNKRMIFFLKILIMESCGLVWELMRKMIRLFEVLVIKFIL